MFDIVACKLNETIMKIAVNSQPVVAAPHLTLLPSHQPADDCFYMLHINQIEVQRAKTEEQNSAFFYTCRA